jgi:hypothetical protein
LTAGRARSLRFKGGNSPFGLLVLIAMRVFTAGAWLDEVAAECGGVEQLAVTLAGGRMASKTAFSAGCSTS